MEGELHWSMVMDGHTDMACAGSIQDALFFGLIFAEAKGEQRGQQRSSCRTCPRAGSS